LQACSELAADVLERERRMAAFMQTNPDLAGEIARSAQDLHGSLPNSLAAHVERFATASGTVVAGHADGGVGIERSDLSLVSDNSSTTLYATQQAAANLVPGSDVTVHGVALPLTSTMVAQTVTQGVALERIAQETKTLAVIPVRVNSIAPPADSSITSAVNGAVEYIRTRSYGNLTFQPQFKSPVTITLANPQSHCGDLRARFDTIGGPARSAAGATADFYIYIMGAICPERGYTGIGGNDSYFYESISRHAVVHELGHNLSFGHSSSSDPVDPMIHVENQNAVPPDFNSIHKSNIGNTRLQQTSWIETQQVGAEGGTFTLASMDQSSGVRALVLPGRCGSGKDYYVESRGGSLSVRCKQTPTDANQHVDSVYVAQVPAGGFSQNNVTITPRANNQVEIRFTGAPPGDDGSGPTRPIVGEIREGEVCGSTGCFTLHCPTGTVRPGNITFRVSGNYAAGALGIFVPNRSIYGRYQAPDGFRIGTDNYGTMYIDRPHENPKTFPFSVSANRGSYRVSFAAQGIAYEPDPNAPGQQRHYNLTSICYADVEVPDQPPPTSGSQAWLYVHGRTSDFLVAPGAQVSVTWSSAGVAYCRAYANDQSLPLGRPPILARELNDTSTILVPVNEQNTTFRLRCFGGDPDPLERQLTVHANVQPPPPFSPLGCTNDPPGDRPGPLRVNPTSINLRVGETKEFNVSGGNLPYSIPRSLNQNPNYDAIVRPDYATCTRLTLTGVAVGNVTLTIADTAPYNCTGEGAGRICVKARDGYTVNLPVIVTSGESDRLIRPESIAVGVGGQTTAAISGGTAPYTILRGPDPTKATASISTSGTLTVRGVAVGTTNVEVQDSSSPAKTTGPIPITVTAREETGDLRANPAPPISLTTGGQPAQVTISGGSGSYLIPPDDALRPDSRIATASLTGSTLTITPANRPGSTAVTVQDTSSPPKTLRIDITVTRSVTNAPPILVIATSPDLPSLTRERSFTFTATATDVDGIRKINIWSTFGGSTVNANHCPSDGNPQTMSCSASFSAGDLELGEYTIEAVATDSSDERLQSRQAIQCTVFRIFALKLLRCQE
jgi:hypothetical protein